MTAAKQIKMYPLVSDLSKVEEPISGGFYIKARKIEQSEIAHAAPVIREVWDWILRQCNHKDNVSLNLKRGQCVRSIKDVQEGLHWHVGYRKMEYSKTQCENALEYLRNKHMITTTKTTRGLIITVCKYATYQDIKNYEYNGEDNKKTTRRQQQGATINKNDKNESNSTPPATPLYRFSHNGFFDRQIEANKQESEIGKYQKLVEFLHEKDDEGDYVLGNVLKIAKQISYKDYLQLKAVEKASNRTLKAVLEGIENYTPKRPYKNLYLTAKDWLEQEKVKPCTES